MKLLLVCTLMLILPACSRDDEPSAKDADTNSAPAARAETPVPMNPEASQGQALYVQNCLVCHQHDGGGVPGMQPALFDNPAVSGTADHLIEIVLRGVGGTETAVPASGDYAMVMPGAAQLSDEQIAHLLTYIRQAWGETKDGASAVIPEEVEAVRAELE